MVLWMRAYQYACSGRDPIADIGKSRKEGLNEKSCDRVKDTSSLWVVLITQRQIMRDRLLTREWCQPGYTYSEKFVASRKTRLGRTRDGHTVCKKICDHCTRKAPSRVLGRDLDIEVTLTTPHRTASSLRRQRKQRRNYQHERKGHLSVLRSLERNVGAPTYVSKHIHWVHLHDHGRSESGRRMDRRSAGRTTRRFC